MPFQEENFSKPEYIEQSLPPKKVVIISCEGCNTEPEYFETIKEKLTDNIDKLVAIELVEKPDKASEPDKVLRNLEKHIEAKFDFKENVDILWLVVDRESVTERKKAIEAIIPTCEEKGYSIAISNPAFEFWLLLHICDITSYDKTTLHQNNWVTEAKKRRFLDKELSNLLDNGFKKRKDHFNQDIVSLDNIKRAVKQEQDFCNQLPELLDELGSNIGCLINDFLVLE